MGANVKSLIFQLLLQLIVVCNRGLLPGYTPEFTLKFTPEFTMGILTEHITGVCGWLNG